MDFTFQTRANTYFGTGCVKKNAAQWVIGKRAFVVTGSHSGRMSGALSDVEETLIKHGVFYEVFEGVENNPTVEQCQTLAEKARALKAECIIAIGGGSPIDAAKAIAVLAANKITTDMMFQNAFDTALPVIAIPTTSGTGSEVTPWSVLTRHSVNNKQSFGNSSTLPAVALLDPAYTSSLSKRVTLHTAMDAFTHCLESIISVKATPVTDALNAEGLRRFAYCMRAMEENAYEDVRDELMLVSLFGGMAIAHTGTTLMHGMGYPLTYYNGLTHGEANCAVMPGYLSLIARISGDRLQFALNALGMDADALKAYVARNFTFTLTLNDAQITQYAALTLPQGSTKNIPYPVTAKEIEDVYRDALHAYIV